MLLIFPTVLRYFGENNKSLEKIIFRLIYGLYVDNTGLVYYRFFYCFREKVKMKTQRRQCHPQKVSKTDVFVWYFKIKRKIILTMNFSLLLLLFSSKSNLIVVSNRCV